MAWERIRKRPEDRVGTNLPDYEECAKTFSWAQARGLLDGLPGGGLNIAHEASDRHVIASKGEKLALRWLGRDGRLQDFTYAMLQAAVSRFANVLVQRGVSKGERVFSLLGRSPELLYRRSRHSQSGLCFLAVVFSVRSGTDQGAHDDR